MSGFGGFDSRLPRRLRSAPVNASQAQLVPPLKTKKEAVLANGGGTRGRDPAWIKTGRILLEARPRQGQWEKE